MAVLEKIRKRSALLFIIIIGALLAFILGDFLNSGRTFFGPGDTYAEVGDVKLKANRFAELQSQMEQQAQNMDGDYMTDQVIMQGLMEGLYNREFDRMGIEVSDNLLSKMVYDPRNYGMVFSSLVSSDEELGQLAQMGLWQGQYVQSGYQQVPYIDLTVYRDAIEKPANYKLDENAAKYLSDRWEKMEAELERQIKTVLYQNMLAGLFQPNKADALVQYENMNNRYDINYVAVSTAAAGDVKVEDADIEGAYEQNKGLFRLLDEKREVAYIYVPVVPSQADYTNARAEFAKAQAALASTDGTIALNKFKGFTKQEGKMTEKEIIQAAQQSRDSRLMTLLNDSSIQAGEVRALPAMQNSMSMVKILGIDKAYDNIELSLMSSQNVKELDSIFTDRTAEAVDKAFADNTAKGAFTGNASLASNSDQLGSIINQTKNLKNAVESAPSASSPSLPTP